MWADILYLSATIPLAIAVIVLNLTNVSQSYKWMFVIPRIALDSSIACLVFRGLKLGSIEDIDYSAQSNPICFAHNHPNLTGGFSDTHELELHGSVVRIELPEKSLHGQGDDGSKIRGSSQWV